MIFNRNKFFMFAKTLCDNPCSPYISETMMPILLRKVRVSGERGAAPLYNPPKHLKVIRKLFYKA